MKIADERLDNIYVAGTDTCAGKTVLSLLLMQFFYAKGIEPFYLKMVQTGCRDAYDIESDARFIYENVSSLKGKDCAESVPYCFRNPKAPYFAARDQGVNIDLEVIKKAIDKKNISFHPVILEAAGGLLVPVTEKALIIDTIRIMEAGTLIAARAGLGTINHTLLAIEALDKRGIRPLGVVFMDFGEKPTPQDMISENIEAVENVSGLKVAGVINKIKNFSNPAKNCYEPLIKIFGA